MKIIFTIFPILVTSELLDNSQIPLNTILDIIVSVKRILNPGCVFLLHTSDAQVPQIQMYERMSLLEKHLSDRNIQSSSVNVHTIVNTSYLKRCYRNYVLNVVFFNEERDNKIFEQISLRNKFANGSWLVFFGSNMNLEQLFSNIYVPFNCEFLTVQKQDGLVALTEFYRVGPALPLQVYKFGNWTFNHGFKWCGLRVYERRNNLTGHVLRAGYKYGDKIRKDELMGDYVDLTDGVKTFFSILWLILENILNFKSVYYRPADNGWGALTQNGSWNGMIGMMLKNEIDVAVDGFLITETRLNVVHYMIPVVRSRNRPFIKLPDEAEPHWSDFLAPFSTELWFAVLAVMLLLAFFTSGLYNTGVNCYGEIIPGKIKYGFLESLFCVYGSFCQQGQGESPRTTSLRTAYLTSFLIGIVLSAAYSASLISHLTMKRVTLPFTSFEGLLQDGSYKLGVTDTSATLNLFDKSKNQLLQKVYKNLILPYKQNLPKSQGDGFKRVCQEHKYAFMSPFDTPLSRYSGLPCDMLEIPHASFSGSLTMPITKNHPFMGIFNHVLLKLRTAGILSRLYHISWPRKPEKWLSPWSSVNLNEVMAIFTVLLGGMVLSVIVLAFEILIFHFDSNRKTSILFIDGNSNLGSKAIHVRINYRWPELL